MSPLNPAFVGAVNFTRSQLNELLTRAKCYDDVYISRHFAERVVERNLDVGTVFAMIAKIVIDYRTHTYNKYSYRVKWKNFSLFAVVDLRKISNSRTIVLKTIYDRDVHDDFDVTISL